MNGLQPVERAYLADGLWQYRLVRQLDLPLTQPAASAQAAE